MPEKALEMRTARRTAGAGSLGRPRWVGIAEWRGAPVVREAKALVPSAWLLAHGRRSSQLECHVIASGRYRAVDPWYEVKGDVVVRRLSPNNRKIEVDKRSAPPLDPHLLQLMGFDLAGVHLGREDERQAIERDLKKRKDGWLLANAEKALAATLRDYNNWKQASDKTSHRRSSD